MHLSRTTAPRTRRDDVARAARFAGAREGRVGFAVLDDRGRLRGVHRTSSFYAASIVEPMLMVALLRSAGDAEVPAADRALLDPMMAAADTAAAIAAFERVRPAGLHALARAAGMRRFSVMDHVLDAVITPADQARFFLRLDVLVPHRHLPLAHTLLAQGDTGEIAGAAGDARVLSRTGARAGIAHEVALVRPTTGERLALAVLTGSQPSADYARETIRGVADRVLSPRAGRDAAARRTPATAAYSRPARR